MIAFSYPPDTFMLTEQSIANDFNPKVKFLGVGVAFPSYKGKFGDKVNGIFGLGAWDPNGPGVKDYFARHKAVNKGRSPTAGPAPTPTPGCRCCSRRSSASARSTAPRSSQEIKTGTFKTILGDIKLEGNRRQGGWHVGQWQGGEFYGIAPANRRAPKQPMSSDAADAFALRARARSAGPFLHPICARPTTP